MAKKKTWKSKIQESKAIQFTQQKLLQVCSLYKQPTCGGIQSFKGSKFPGSHTRGVQSYRNGLYAGPWLMTGTWLLRDNHFLYWLEAEGLVWIGYNEEGLCHKGSLTTNAWVEHFVLNNGHLNCWSPYNFGSMFYV